VRKIAHAQKRKPLLNLHKILQHGRHPNVIAYENFGDDWLRGSGVAGVKSRPSSLASTLKLCRITVQVYDNNKHGQSNLT